MMTTHRKRGLLTCTGEGCGTLAGLRNSLIGGSRFWRSSRRLLTCRRPGYVCVGVGVMAPLAQPLLLLDEDVELLSMCSGLRGTAPEQPLGQPPWCEWCTPLSRGDNEPTLVEEHDEEPEGEITWLWWWCWWWCVLGDGGAKWLALAADDVTAAGEAGEQGPLLDMEDVLE